MTNAADLLPPLELGLPAVSDSVTEARRSMASYASRAGARAEDVSLAVAEAVGNAVIHAYPQGKPGRVTVMARLETGGLIVAIEDDGVGMRPNPRSPGLGVGLPLIARLSDECSIRNNDRGGTAIRMVFRVRS